MPVAFDILPEKRVILTACVGNVASSEIMACVAAVRADSRYRRDFAGICDVSEGNFTLGRDDARLLAQAIGAGADRSTAKWAFVIHEPKATALVLVFGLERDPNTPVRVFSTIEAARNWLAIDVSESDLAGVRDHAAAPPR